MMTNQTRLKLCQLNTQVWFEDKKTYQLNFLSSFLISNKHTQHSFTQVNLTLKNFNLN